MRRLIVLCTMMLVVFSAKSQLATEILQIRQQYDLMGGVVTLYCADQIVEHVPFGWADYNRQIPVSDSSMFRIASISKTVTAMACMKLVDQGLLHLDSNISNALGYSVVNPNYPSIEITARMLLSHQSSLIDGSTYGSFLSATYQQHPIPDLSELLSTTGAYYTTNQFNNTQPGTYFNYSNINYVILGTLIEKISGQRFDEYVRNEILIPAGVEGSFNVNHISNIDNVAVLYRKNAGSWVAQADDYQGTYPGASNLQGYVPGTNGGRFAPQGGLRCSAKDLSRLMQLLLNNGRINGDTILSASSVQQMMDNEWTYNAGNGNNYYGLFNSWGLGIHRIQNIPNGDVVLDNSTNMFGHPGEAYGLVSDAYIDTSRMLGIVFITNGCGNGYQLGPQSAFYSVEADVFRIVSPYADQLNCTTGLKNEANASSTKVIVAPNPCVESFRIFTSPALNAKNYILFDLYGKKIQAGEITRQNQVIRLEEKDAACYILKVYGDEIHTVKVLKY